VYLPRRYGPQTRLFLEPDHDWVSSEYWKSQHRFRVFPQSTHCLVFGQNPLGITKTLKEELQDTSQAAAQSYGPATILFNEGKERGLVLDMMKIYSRVYQFDDKTEVHNWGWFENASEPKLDFMCGGGRMIIIRTSENLYWTLEWTGYAFRTHCMFQLDIEKNNLTWMFTAPEPNADNSLNMILVFKKGRHVMITVKRIWETPASSSNVSPQYPDLCLYKGHVFQDFLRRPKFLSRNLVAIWRENLLEDDQLFHRLGLDLPLTVYDLDKWNSCAESKFCAVGIPMVARSLQLSVHPLQPRTIYASWLHQLQCDNDKEIDMQCCLGIWIASLPIIQY
jgi:hypothetical protein